MFDIELNSAESVELQILAERDSLVKQLKDAQDLIAELKSTSAAQEQVVDQDIGTSSHVEFQFKQVSMQGSDTNISHNMEHPAKDMELPVQRSKRRSLAAKDAEEKGGKVSRSCGAWTVEEFAELCEGVRKFDENWCVARSQHCLVSICITSECS